MSEPTGSTALLEHAQTDTLADAPWSCLLHNDEVNLAEYVTGVLMKVLKCGKDEAERHMLLAHTNGRTAVTSGSLADCEKVANQLMAHTLWATLEKA